MADATQFEWLMIAFDRAPGLGFKLAKSRKCWFRRLPSREAAIAVKQQLINRGIRYKCEKVLRQDPKRIPARRGKAARAERVLAQPQYSAERAAEIYYAGVLAGRKEARAKRENPRLRDELARQKAKQIEMEQARRADAIAHRYGPARPH